MDRREIYSVGGVVFEPLGTVWLRLTRSHNHPVRLLSGLSYLLTISAETLAVI